MPTGADTTALQPSMTARNRPTACTEQIYAIFATFGSAGGIICARKSIAIPFARRAPPFRQTYMDSTAAAPVIPNNEMRILIAPDKFKGTLTAAEAAETIAAGIRRAAVLQPSSLRLLCRPMADGGDGTLDIIAEAAGMTSITAPALDAAFGKIEAAYAISRDGTRACIEAARTIGLAMLAPERRDPMLTSSFGLGMLIADAARRGCEEITVTVGGSATSDCGAGMLSALGWRFRDRAGHPVPRPDGGDLTRIASAERPAGALPADKCRFTVLCDVDNPLLGPHGAAHTFAPQKGADEAAVQRLEQGAEHFAALSGGAPAPGAPRTGAAGGIAWALARFCGAELLSGAEHVSGLYGLGELIAGADLVITGEGRFDAQSLDGKVVGHIASLARGAGVPVALICGDRDRSLDASLLRATGIASVWAITDRASTAEAMAHPARQLARTAAELAESLSAGRGR